MMCNCISLLNDKLKDTNTGVDYTIVLRPGVPAMLKIATYKKDTKRREKPMSIVASYCPVCGVKYESA